MTTPPTPGTAVPVPAPPKCVAWLSGRCGVCYGCVEVSLRAEITRITAARDQAVKALERIAPPGGDPHATRLCRCCKQGDESGSTHANCPCFIARKALAAIAAANPVKTATKGPTMEIPRRNRLDKLTPAETAIMEAMRAVEEAGADVRLTDAVVLLGRARDRVADFVDGVKPETTL